MKVTKAQSKEILEKFTGVLIKICFAFLYQELIVKVPDWLYNDVPMLIAVNHMPKINAYASKMSGFPQTDPAVVKSDGVYPADTYFCRHWSPHAIWHEESASGFVEITFLADFVNSIIVEAQK